MRGGAAPAVLPVTLDGVGRGREVTAAVLAAAVTVDGLAQGTAAASWPSQGVATRMELGAGQLLRVALAQAGSSEPSGTG